MLKILFILSLLIFAEGCREIQKGPSGGKEVSRDEHSSVVLIESFIHYDRSYWCVGVLISANYVLTTARCVIEAMFSNIHVNAYKRTDEFEKGREIHKATEFKFKESFDRYINHNDIALVKLPTTLNLSIKNYKPAKLPSFEMQVNVTGISVGWGLYDFYDKDENATEYKQDINLRFMPEEDCRKAYGTRVDWTDIGTAGRGCLTKLSGVNCVSGYGSPFFIDGEIHALHSFGAYQYCTSDLPNGITLINSYHLQWIIENSDYQ
jgi:secreted trypsin-like serine protease